MAWLTRRTAASSSSRVDIFGHRGQAIQVVGFFRNPAAGRPKKVASPGRMVSGRAKRANGDGGIAAGHSRKPKDAVIAPRGARLQKDVLQGQRLAIGRAGRKVHDGRPERSHTNAEVRVGFLAGDAGYLAGRRAHHGLRLHGSLGESSKLVGGPGGPLG
ncbi:hypothetical protein BC828DRAFT_377599 [Blastocladiella britannica]|nr:hypothetical protein BC828DRAFT_377599 [Blastocladiella britannica]